MKKSELGIGMSLFGSWRETLKRVFTKSRHHEAKGFVRVTDKVTSTLSTHQIAACERIGRISACLVADCDWIGRQEAAPKVGALGDIGCVGVNQSDFECFRAGRSR
jgi:hypothetical protein